MKSQGAETVIGGSNARFPTTVWSSVFQREGAPSPGTRERLGLLLHRYWKAIYRTIRFRWRRTNEDAKDLTQTFLVKVLEEGAVRGFRPDHGSFRSFLKGTLAHFMTDDLRVQQSLKRGGGCLILPLEPGVEPPDLAAGKNPEEIFDRAWAGAVLEEALRELKELLILEGREIHFRVYEMLDLGDDPGGAPSYREVARRLGISEARVTHYLHTTRRRLRRILVDRIGEYATSEDEVYRELEHLLAS